MDDDFQALAVGGHDGSFLVVDIVNDDMPFLLDSVIGALGEQGLAPELVAHPIFEVRRDSEGRLTAINPADGPSNGVPRESFIHLQIRKTGPLPPAQELESAIGRVLADVRSVVQDFKAMRDGLGRVIQELEQKPPPATADADRCSVTCDGVSVTAGAAPGANVSSVSCVCEIWARPPASST